MNNRDPFNLRKSPSPALNVLRNNAASLRGSLAEGGERLSQGLTTAAHTVTANMSSYAPYGLPTQRLPSETPAADQWQSAGHSRTDQHSNGGIGEKIGEFFSADKNDSLPMYKDKPYGYPAGRKPPIYRQRRVIAAVLLLLSGLSWWFGIISFPTLSGGSSGSKSTGSGKSSSSNSWSGRKIKADWPSRADAVRETFKSSFSAYEKYAWGFDEFSPVSKAHRQMTPNGMGWIIVDAIDTMMLMNLTDELTHARQWIHNNLTYDQDHDVNTFETTIRMLGGLLSAHYLSTEFPEYAPVDDEFSDDMYIEIASDLAERLLGAYSTDSGVPLASINLHTMKGIPSHDDGGASSTAEATTLQLEMKYLAHLTGEDVFWHKAEHVMKVVDDNNAEAGLVPIFIYAHSGSFRGNNIRLGSRGDSYYEYLIKQYLQTSEEEPLYEEMWNETLAGVKKHLITYSSPSNFTVLAERPSGLNHDISPKMDHLVCFMPGTIALATTGGRLVAEAKADNWGPQQDEDMQLAEDLMKTCWGMYKVTPTGLAGEITHFNIYDPPRMYNDYERDAKPVSPAKFQDEDNEVGKEDFIVKAADSHNLQRPETVESLFYMWRITGDQKYREWGWEMYENFVRWMEIESGEGFSSLSDVLRVPPPMRDNMESFWLAETLKYFYLLFSSNDILPLTDVVFNTEAHPFPRFSLGKLFETGWSRIPRDASGNLIQRKAEAAVEHSYPHQHEDETHASTGIPADVHDDGDETVGHGGGADHNHDHEI